jgi:hypothetical protein
MKPAANIIGLRILAQFSFPVCLLLAGVTACKEKSSPPSQTGSAKPSPVLKAEPNPPARHPVPGTVSITGSTGDGSFGQVFVSVDSGPEKMFVQGSGGTDVASWIYPQASYRFRLYAGKEHETVLATETISAFGPGGLPLASRRLS